MEQLITEQQIDGFLSKISKTFPNFVAGIICDENGFSIGAKIPQNFHIQENILALSALTKKRKLIDESNVMRVKRNIGKSKNVKLLVLLEKSSKYIHKFKDLNEILEGQDLF